VVSAAAAVDLKSEVPVASFENLAPKYSYQQILVNSCLVLINTHNHLLYPEKLALLPVCGMSKTK